MSTNYNLSFSVLRTLHATREHAGGRRRRARHRRRRQREILRGQTQFEKCGRAKDKAEGMKTSPPKHDLKL